jgi:hypothetical protein
MAQTFPQSDFFAAGVCGTIEKPADESYPQTAEKADSYRQENACANE